MYPKHSRGSAHKHVYRTAKHGKTRTWIYASAGIRTRDRSARWVRDRTRPRPRCRCNWCVRACVRACVIVTWCKSTKRKMYQNLGISNPTRLLRQNSVLGGSSPKPEMLGHVVNCLLRYFFTYRFEAFCRDKTWLQTGNAEVSTCSRWPFWGMTESMCALSFTARVCR
jgi:hypothetical protein